MIQHCFFKILNLKKILLIFFLLLIVFYMSIVMIKSVITKKVIKSQLENIHKPIAGVFNKIEVQIKSKDTTKTVKDVAEPLGSIKYVEKIHKIAKKSGNRIALSTIMIDVDNNRNELDNNEPNNISKFHILISSLINKINSFKQNTCS